MENYNWKNRSKKDNGNNPYWKNNITAPRQDPVYSHRENHRQKRQSDGLQNERSNSHIKYGKPKFNNTNQSLFNNPNLVKYLEDLSTKNSEEVMMLVAQKEEEFKKFLDKDMAPDVLVVTLRVINNVCQANFTELMVKALSLTLSTNFFKTLENYLTNLPFESDVEKSKNKYYHEDINRFWIGLVEFLKKIIELIPRAASDKLTVLLQQVYLILSNIESTQKYKIDAVIKVNIKGMIRDLKNELEQIDGNNVKRRNTDFGPPENFRMLSTIPTNEDLSDYRPYLRPCKIKEQYDSVEHYLDVQFRLLKEDFVRPLRNGIREYLGEQKNQTIPRRNNDLRIYKNTKLMGFKIKEKSSGLQLYFGKLNHVNWFKSKRLMFGSLLLLSRDHFKSVLFVTVANRDEEDLKEGYVTIAPCVDTVITPSLYNCNLVMLESKIFFEPYYEVLTAMKNINNSNFPLEPYFIQAKTIVGLPKYLKETLISTKKLIFGKTISLPISYLHFRKTILLPINDFKNWPSAEKLNFDESQLSAFKSALTQEFAIVQGPPGTGKTFLALQVVGALLENKTKWRHYGPIVIVCLTNHALDSFLEGILASTESIVRVGSRSKNENLQRFTLIERRKHCQLNGFAKSNMFSIKRDLEELLKSIKTTNLLLELLKTPNILVPIDCLQSCYNEYPLKNFKCTEDLAGWLIGREIIPLIKKFEAIENENQKKHRIKESHFSNVDDDMFTDADLILDYEQLSTIVIKGDLNILNLLNREIQFVTNEINKMRTLPYSPIFQWQQHLQMLFIKRNILQYEFSLHPLSNKSSQKSNNYRWQKYRQWVQQSYEHLNDQKHKLEQKYYEVNSRLNEATQLLNLSVLQEHDVIGLTTTCAAKLQPSLRALKAPIVLVEEAAEILESHIVCSMTKHCQQVILIGDHKQLKPKASVYELGKKYNLNVSLFERMVNIRGDCQQLTYQHRMRPQIAKLIRPAIYEKLYDHEIVLNYPDVMGLSNNVFFINHQNREHYNDNDDSCINDHEVKFLTAFAKHLVLQGYKPEEITILCTYTGQMFDFMNETKYHELLKKVRVTTVDNFQGEENKIILLSLVRNNGEGKIGFLKEENRVCVALSRAREGLYIMGNMDDLLVENDIWPQIKKVLEEDNAIGDSLAVKCQVHSDQIFQMTNAEDFVQCPEGGCMLKCDLLLSCGHNCTRVCHILDREHQKYCCRQPCNRTCPNNHPCSLLCEQPCQPCQVLVEKTLKCGHTGLTPCSADPDTFNCLVDVEVILPACNHKVTKCCYLPLSKCLCDYDCDIRLECGHRCARKCHISDDSDHAEYKCLKDCTKKNIKCSNDHMCKKRCHEECEPCSIHVTKTRSCGHYYKNIECSKDVESLYCSRPCKKGLLNCGHKCVLKCGDDCKNCQTKVEKESSCGHVIKVKCCEEATPALCDKKCPKMLPCGHPCTNMCKDNCTVACQVLVQVDKLGLCGHPAWLPCMKQTDPKSPEFLKYCKEPCKNELACGHFCKGNCGQCLQGRLHVVCSEPCPRIFVCGHACKTLCNQECQPCNEPCKIRCGHSRCPKRCGMPCKPCQEPCELSCEHQSCSRKCHQYCSIKPCEQPCKKLLKCNHPCIGFCGDPCPPLCRICNFEEVTTIVFGKEDEPDAKFVLLSDCKHSIESKALMSSVINPTNSDGSVLIKALTCPICSTPISNCKRIMNNIRQNLNSIIILKKKFFGEDEKDYKKKQQLYINIVSTLLKDPKTNIPELSKLKNYMTHLKKICSPFQKSKKQILSSKEVCIFKSITDILNELVSLIKQIKQTNINIEFIIKQVNLIVESLPFTLSISKQRLEDINVELRRLHLMVKVYNLFSDGGLSSTNKTEFVQIIKKLTCFNRFTKTIEQDIIGMSATLIEENKKNLLIERKVITQAVTQAEGLKSGAWFKCPNGHFYAVGDCGGPTEERKCAECNEKIGGRNHTLTVGNKLATEIDGASRSAWPTTLNR